MAYKHAQVETAWSGPAREYFADAPLHMTLWMFCEGRKGSRNRRHIADLLGIAERSVSVTVNTYRRQIPRGSSLEEEWHKYTLRESISRYFELTQPIPRDANWDLPATTFAIGIPDRMSLRELAALLLDLNCGSYDIVAKRLGVDAVVLIRLFPDQELRSCPRPPGSPG